MNTTKEKKVLLVIEDDVSLRNVLRDKLTDEGFNVLEAENEENGLNTALKEHPDLVLLDIVMPKMDGMTMMKELRKADNWGKNVPIILLTNLSPDSETINKAITEHEPAYYLLKSSNALSDVTEKIKERLSAKGGEAEQQV